jgi:hypothetical protein
MRVFLFFRCRDDLVGEVALSILLKHANPEHSININNDGKMFHTPPMRTMHKDESIEESYLDPLDCGDDDADFSGFGLTTGADILLETLINDFMVELKKPKYDKPLDGDQLSAEFQHFYDQLGQCMSNGSKESFNKVEKGEDIACSLLYDRLFKRFKNDIEINDYIKKKSSLLTKLEVDYNQLLDIEIQLDRFVISFNSLNEYKTPREKLLVIQSIHGSVSTEVASQIDEVNGDHMLPILIYLILKSDVDVYLNYLYIKRFRNHKTLKGEEVYCLTNIEAALMFIQCLELKEHEVSTLSDEEKDILLNSKSFEHEKQILEPVRPQSPFDLGRLMNKLDIDDLNPLNKLMKWRNAYTKPLQSPIEERLRDQLNATTAALTTEMSEKREATFSSIDKNKFIGRRFEDMNIAELREMFDDYMILVDHN